MEESELLDELRRLPMQPSVVTRLLGVLDDANASAAAVARSLEGDPGMCARVLQLANSPYFGLAGTVGSVERAVVALGNSVIRSLAVSTAAGLFSERGERMLAGFWEHSVSVAAAASLVAQTMRVPAGDALCAGLLHDLGAALAFRFRPDQYEAIGAIEDAERLEAERAAFGTDHAELGAVALGAWHLPQAIVDAITQHHEPGQTATPLACCVVVGEALAIAAGGDAVCLHEPVLGVPEALELAGMADVDVDALLLAVGDHSSGLGSLLAA